MKNKQTMKKIIFIVGLLGLVVIGGLYAKQEFCDSKPQIENTKNGVLQNDKGEKSVDSIYFKPHYFNILRQYIMINGKVEKVNASSIALDTIYVEYHVLSYDKWELRVDGSNRIYFSMKQPEYKQYGNILMIDDSIVKVECQDNLDREKIFNTYNEILKTINK